MKTFTPDSSIASDVIPSLNYGERSTGRQPDMILLHYTGMPDVEGAIAQLCTAGTEVSAHYIVLEDGRIVQCVPESKRAWHAGVSCWAGEEDVNSCSIGVEIINRGHDWATGFPAAPDRRDRCAAVSCCAERCRRSRPRAPDVAPARKGSWRSSRGIRWPTRRRPLVQPRRSCGETLKLGSTSDDVVSMQTAFARYMAHIPTHAI
jgi:N-acetylmuramoyl-L-alanine amidase